MNGFGIVAAITKFIDERLKQVRSVLKLSEHSIPRTVDIGLFEKDHCLFPLFDENIQYDDDTRGSCG